MSIKHIGATLRRAININTGTGIFTRKINYQTLLMTIIHEHVSLINHNTLAGATHEVFLCFSTMKYQARPPPGAARWLKRNALTRFATLLISFLVFRVAVLGALS